LPATGIVSEGDYHDPVYCERKGDAGPRDGAGRRHPGLFRPETVGGALRALAAAILRPVRAGPSSIGSKGSKTGCFRISASKRYEIAAIAEIRDIAAAPSVGVALENLLAVSGGSLVAWSERRAAYRELSALDDRMLRDIGITRADNPAVIAA